MLGPAVWDHSRFDHSVFGSEEDRERLAAVFSALFPGADWAATSSKSRRDAMHVATAIRYGYTGFLTRERRLLNKGHRR